jgi:hypothetical protein
MKPECNVRAMRLPKWRIHSRLDAMPQESGRFGRDDGLSVAKYWQIVMELCQLDIWELMTD